MFIRKGTARKIIEEISKVVDYDINIMNEEGFIIASTNSDRINTFHEAAYRIIKNNLIELIVREDGEYEGCRKGINLPIFFNKKIIGVIGITGEVSEILGYGKIIKKMTEILILDLFTYYKRNMEEQARLIFVTEWLNGNLNENQAYVEGELKKYNIPSGGNFVVATMNIFGAPKVHTDEGIPNDSAERYVLELLTMKGVLAIQNSGLYILIIKCDNHEDTKGFLQKALTQIQLYSKNRVLCTVGSPYKKYIDACKSYKEAMRVMRLKETDGDGLYYYDDEIVNILLEDTPTAYKSRCILNVFKNCAREEAMEFSNFILIYFKSNGSIKVISDHLFIHKNTVQYKINKLKTKTGLDIRVMEDLLTLTLAARWYSFEIDKN